MLYGIFIGLMIVACILHGPAPWNFLAVAAVVIAIGDAWDNRR